MTTDTIEHNRKLLLKEAESLFLSNAVKTSKMVGDGRLSGTNGKVVFKEVTKTHMRQIQIINQACDLALKRANKK